MNMESMDKGTAEAAADAAGLALVFGEDGGAVADVILEMDEDELRDLTVGALALIATLGKQQPGRLEEMIGKLRQRGE